MTNAASVPAAPPSAPGSAAALPGCLSYGLLALTGSWVVLTTAAVHGIGWFVDQTFLIQGLPFPWFVWPLISWGHGLLLALPVLPLAVFTRAPRFRAVYRTWALATAFLFLLALVRALPIMRDEAAALAQIALSLGASIVLFVVARRRNRHLGMSARALLLALALAPLIAVPSLMWGALGSPTDSVLNLLAGLSLGLFAGILFGAFLFQPLTRHTSGPGWDIVFGGLSAGVALAILGSGFGFNGSQLLLLITLPPLGLALAGLDRLSEAGPETNQSWLPIAALVGLTAAASLMFVDPEEITLILGGDEILQWAFRAAWVSLALGCVVSVVVGIAGWRLKRPPAVGLSLGGVALTWLGGALIYFLIGQPGFHGEQLFVILKDQADLTPAYAIADRAERLTYVYTTLTQEADTSQSKLRATLDRLHVGYHPYYLVNALEVNGGPLLRAYLSLQPEVDRVIDSQHLRPLPAPIPVGKGSESAPDEPQWNITSIGADRVWNELGVTGAGIVVGQSDSGVDSAHPALKDGYRGRAGGDADNWLDPWNDTRAPTDIGGHGTHALGSILGRGGIGVAPGAEWFGCVNLARNLGNPPVYLTCMQFMLAPYPPGGDPLHDGDPTRAAHVLNNSWGCPPIEGCDAGALGPAVSALRAAGIFVVASAGNEGPLCSSVSDPIAIYDDAFSVGAIDKLGDLAFFSSRGPVQVDGSERMKPDIAAPGVDVLSSTPGDTYATFSGTSMAGPHVVGTVALMWSANPKLIGDINRTEQILRETARPYQGVISAQGACDDLPLPNNGVGYGLLDAYAAVKAALAEK